MTPQVILEIIRLSLEITLEILKGIPVEDRQKFWQAHEGRLEFWQDVLDKLTRTG